MPSFDPAGNDGAAAGDREDVLNGHQEGFIGIADRLRDVGVDGVHELVDALAVRAVGIGAAVLQCL